MKDRIKKLEETQSILITHINKIDSTLHIIIKDQNEINAKISWLYEQIQNDKVQ